MAKKMRVALGTLDHIASGMRKASAEMAGKIEKAKPRLSVSAKIRQRKSRRVRVVKPEPR